MKKFRGRKRTSLRLTGLFKSSRPGMLWGRLRTDEVRGLAKIVKRALAEKRGIVFFAFRNDEGPTIYTLFADVQRDMADVRRQRRGDAWGRRREDEPLLDDSDDSDDSDDLDDSEQNGEAGEEDSRDDDGEDEDMAREEIDL